MHPEPSIELAIYAFGGLSIRLAGRVLDDVIPLQTRALLLYVCLQGQRATRETLASLPWSKIPAELAAANQVYEHLSEYVEIKGSEITVRAWLDVHAFESTLDDLAAHHAPLNAAQVTRLEAALALYQGDFLDGVQLSRESVFIDWAATRRRALRARFVQAASRLLADYLEQHKVDAGIALALRVLRCEPLHEPTHRHLMQFYVLNANRPLALRQFEQIQVLLRDSSGVEPEAATLALYEQIVVSEDMPPSQPPDVTPPSPASDTLPSPATPLVGREVELDELAHLLTSPEQRLVTILAPGGMGKTRLALEAARRQVSEFAGNVCFVPLQPLTEIEQIVPAVAQHLQFAFVPDERSPRQQLLDYLSSKKLLLVLDNLEHVLEGAPLIAEMLEAAPEVRVLVTSREKLNLSGETVYPLGEMPFPSQVASQDVRQYDAVNLLVQAARQVLPDFALTAENRFAVARVCQLTGGVPLGIMLATAWLDTMSLERIADEIQQNVDFLGKEMYDAPGRRRSVRGVFESAWSRLEPAEQQVFIKLTIFRGGWTPEAAEALTGATPRILQTLVSKSLVLRAENRRYDIHELLWQYGHERLESGGALSDARHYHSQYYAEFLHRREADLKGRRQLAAIEEIESDLDNIRQAWNQALDDRDMTRIEKMLFSLVTYVSLRSRQVEFVPVFAEAEQRLRPRYTADFARLLTYLGRLMHELARYAEAEYLLREALAIAAAQNDRATMAFSRVYLGLVVYELQQEAEAVRLLSQGIDLYETIDDEYGLAIALFQRAHLAGKSGQPEQALAFARRALDIQRRIGDEIGVANSLGDVAAGIAHLGDYREAEYLLREALSLRRRLSLPAAIIYALRNLAFYEFRKGNTETARHYAEEALSISREIGHPFAAGRSLLMLAYIDVAADRLDRAEERIEQIPGPGFVRLDVQYLFFKGLIQLGRGNWRGARAAPVEYLKRPIADLPSLMPVCMLYMGFLVAHQGQAERGLELAALALNQLQMPRAIADSPFVSRHLKLIQHKMDRAAYTIAWERGKTLNFEAIVGELKTKYGSEKSVVTTG